MPIVGLICGDHAEAVGPDHFHPVGDCLYVHHDFALKVVDSQAGRPAGWTVTEVMGCLRKTAILKTLNVVVDPHAYMAMETGTAWHRHMGSNGTRWHGELAGLPLSGAPDDYATGAYIGDHKFSKRKPPAEGRVSHRVQVSIYALLAAQEGLPPFKYGVIWHAWPEGCAGVRFDLMSEADVLAYELHDGWTIEQNIKLAKMSVNMAPLGAVPNIRSYPLTGKLTPFGTKTACDYCAVRRDCERLET